MNSIIFKSTKSVLRTVGGMGLLLLLSIPSLRASEDAEPAPQPPLVASAPDPSAWTIVVRQKQARQKPVDDHKQVDAYKRLQDIYPCITSEAVEKSGKNRHEETVYDNGKKSTIYLYNGWVLYHFAQFPPDRVLMASASDRDSPVNPRILTDFPDVNWIRPEVFVKTVTYRKQRCFYYEDKNAEPLNGGDLLVDAPKGVRAWISVETRLPVAVQDAGILKIFTYIKEPPKAIELPEDFAKTYETTAGSLK